jgi:hypothetical protein
MNRQIIYSLLLSFCVTSIHGAAFGPDGFKCNSPIFYAALAEAAYQSHKHSAQSTINVYYNGATVVAHKEHFSKLFGKTTFIGVKDKFGNFHVAIEGSNSAHNWLGNAVAPINGLVNKYDVPEGTIKDMYKLIRRLTQQYGALMSLIGHSQGGMFASQIASYQGKHDDKHKYKETQVITFNGFKIKPGKNQIHFAIGNEMAATLCSKDSRYTYLPHGGGKLAIGPNHGMKHFLNYLPHKNWPDVIKK